MEIHGGTDVSGCSVGDSVDQTDGIWLSASEVNFITQLLVELPFKTAAPIIQILGAKMMEVRNGN